MSIEALKTQYSECAGRANRLRETMTVQLGELLARDRIALGVPMESRVKSWESIEDKLERKGLSITDINALDDLIGLRLILLFRSDLDTVNRLIAQTFDVLSSEDTARRLNEAQFGYQSQHYILRIPSSWQAIPSMADLRELKVEVQVRTLAQHMWAAASHKLQYKQEKSVPPPLRRTIHRVAALLETVDLEFDRVLVERKEYEESGIPALEGSEPLNVDLLASILGDLFPPQNRKDEEDYGELLSDLDALSIRTSDGRKSLLQKHRNTAIDQDKREVAKRKRSGRFTGTSEERIRRGVFYSHCGLTRKVLLEEFGKKAENIFSSRKKTRRS